MKYTVKQNWAKWWPHSLEPLFGGYVNLQCVNNDRGTVKSISSFSGRCELVNLALIESDGNQVYKAMKCIDLKLIRH